ncbi:T9SS type A sorting domain-containing protein [Hymenobacter koreensis]|uniref:T9SS type A sorting domain-containing protein n=1 Tax=Hymenobacter koreensis TaxID=1084523 RepID=UPI0031E68A40
MDPNPLNPVLGDIDGDGDLDMLVPSTGSDVVSVRLNSGLNSAGFVVPAANAAVSVAGTPRTAVLGDVDGDGDLDLIATQNFSGSTVSLRLNNGSGVFAPPALNPEISAGSNPLNAALGDVDGDGDLDLLILNNADNTASIRLNSGLNSANFVAPAANAEVGVGVAPLGLALGDVDGDGDLDLLTASNANGSGNTVSVRLNNGSGAFAAPALNPEVSVGLGPVTVALGDLDGDGDLDLVTNNFNANTASIRVNSGLNSANFVAPAANPEVGTGLRPQSAALGDVDGDGDLDLLTANVGSNAVSVRLNNGSANFTPPAVNAEIPVGNNPTGLALGDLDNDGDLDFAASNFGPGTVSVRLNENATDLIVSSPQNVSGSYNNVTVTATGVATLTGALTVATSFTVQTGGTLNTACQPLTGAGAFTLADGAVLVICDPAGISLTGATGAVQLTGTRSFSPNATYVYNGSTAQVTGTGLPSQVRNLRSENPVALTLSGPTSIAQVLTVAGAGNVLLNGQELMLLSGSGGTALVVNSSTGVVSGSTGVMQRAIEGSGNPAGIGYRHYSSPVTGSTVADLAAHGFAPTVNSAYNSATEPLAVNPFPNVFGYDQNRLALPLTGITDFDKGWFSPTSLTDPLVVGRGYTVNIPNSAVVDFRGSFNQGTVTIGGLNRLAPVPTASADQTGWHLVGNPYPSPLDWGTVPDANRPNVDAAVYVFQSTSQYGGIYRSFVNGTGAGSGLIAAGQGFFVRASTSGATGSITLTNANRSTTYASQPVFQRPVSNRPQVQLTLRNAAGSLSDDVYVYAQAGASPAFDGRFDAYKLFNSTGLNVAAVGSNRETLSVQGLAPLTGAEVVVPLHVGVPVAGTYSLHAAQLALLPAGTRAYLRDAQNGRVIDFHQQATYTFTTSPTAPVGRFALLLSPSRALAASSPALGQQITFYPNPAHDAVTVELPAALRQQVTTVTLMSALGQLVRTFELAGAGPLPLTGLAPGIYTLRFVTPAGTVAKRLVIE